MGSTRSELKVDGVGDKRDSISKQVKDRLKVAKSVAVAVSPVLGHPGLASVVTSPKIGELTQKALIWGAEFGHASTGVWIKGLRGVARTDAALARLGLGTLANGGYGIAGGLKVATIAGTAVSTAVFAGWLLNAAVSMSAEIKAERSRARIALCTECQGLLPEAEAGVAELNLTCPHCRNIQKPAQG